MTSPNKGMMLASKAEKNPFERNAAIDRRAAQRGKSWLNLESI
jgi:hypothetical protein